MKRFFKCNNWLFIDIICSLFILLFVYAAISKITDVQKFRIQLGKSPLLAPFVGIVFWFVPAFEIGTALMLMFKKLQLLALYLSYFLMVVFTSYIITILNFSEYIPCSCGGILENMTWNQHLIFNLIFVIAGIVGVLIYPKKETIAIARGSRKP